MTYPKKVVKRAWNFLKLPVGDAAGIWKSALKGIVTLTALVAVDSMFFVAVGRMELRLVLAGSGCSMGRSSRGRVRGLLCGLLAGGMAMLCLGAIAPRLAAQAPAAPPAADDNPFPGAPQQAPAAKPADSNQSKPKQDAPKPAVGDNDNPFPGESTNAPIIPVEQPDGARSADGGPGAAGNGGEGDPVKSPDGTGAAPASVDDGFSSSRSGFEKLPGEDNGAVDNPSGSSGDSGTKGRFGRLGKTDNSGKPAKPKTRAEVLKEDIDVGDFYMDRKNWKAAEGRFEAAFALDSESPDAVFGLAEAERHLNLNDKARQHYQLFLFYDPNGPHSRAAQKAVDELPASESRHSGVSQPSPGGATPQK